MTATGNAVASIFRRPTSVRLSTPTTRAVKRRPSSSRTWASSMWVTTWAFVRISPLLSMITPEARSRIWLIRALAGSGQANRSAKSYSGAISSSMLSRLSSRPMRSVLMSTTEVLRLAASDEKPGAAAPARSTAVGAAMAWSAGVDAAAAQAPSSETPATSVQTRRMARFMAHVEEKAVTSLRIRSSDRLRRQRDRPYHGV
jgi:hypothetical protein